MHTPQLLLLPALAVAGAGAMAMSHVVIRQVSLPAMACDASTMGFIALNSFAVTSLCSAYVSCEEVSAAGGGNPVEFPDLAATARDQARDINCVGVCRCLPRPAALREPAAAAAAVVANDTDVRVVNATVAHSFEG